MASYPESMDLMLAAWNERDLSRVRALLERALAPLMVFIDPTIVAQGIDEFEQNVREFRGKYPQAHLRRSSGVDSHRDLYRYHWDRVSGSRCPGFRSKDRRVWRQVVGRINMNAPIRGDSSCNIKDVRGPGFGSRRYC